MPAPLSRSAARWRLLAILALVLVLFAPSLRNTFALDDRLIAKAVREGLGPNVMVQEVQPLARYFTTNYWQGIDPKDVLYRPVTVLSYAVLYAAIGRHLDGEAGEALPQHAANVLLHLLAVWLVYCLARRVHLPRAASLLAALVFGAHAIHSEVVAGVVGRAELLAFDFGALATLAFVHAVRPTVRRVAWLLASAVALFVAFASKESAVAWAPFLLVVQFVRGPFHVRPVVVRWLATVVPPLALFLGLRASMLSGLGVDADAWTMALERSTAGWRLGNGLVQWAYGLLSSVLPVHLAADHGPAVFTPTTSLLAPAVLGALALMVVTCAAGLLVWRRQPILFLAMATFFGHSFLTSNVPFRIGTDYAERLYYTPSLGLAFVAGWLATRARGRWRRLLGVGAVLWLSWNGWRIVQRNGVWRDDPTLFAAEVVNQPRSARMQANYAELLRQRDDQDGMARHLERVVELFPEHAQAWNLLGAYHFNAGRKDEGIVRLRRSLTAGYFDPRKRVEAAVNLALALATTGRALEAAEPLEVALATDALALAARVPHLRRHLTSVMSYEWFDALLARLEAAAPGAQFWPYQRAWLAHDHQRAPAAIEHARRAVALAPAQPLLAESKLILAVALFATGERADAKDVAQDIVRDATTPATVRDSAHKLMAQLQ